jgi:hypothetical protein
VTTTELAADPSPSPAGAQPGRRWVKLALAIVCLAIAMMWVYALFFASKKAAYRVDDAAWRQHAQATCAVYEQQRLALVDTSAGYIAHPSHEQMLQRADVVDAATDLLERELDEITSFPVSSERDQNLIGKYRGYYQTLLHDRRVYTRSLRAFELQPYGETKVDGGPVTNVIVDFATVNEMKSCAPPGELGGDL